MSCCQNCQAGHQCNGLGEPYSIGSYVLSGSVIAWGGYLRDLVGATRWSSSIEGQLKSALIATGGFSRVDAANIAGHLNLYVAIKVVAQTDFAKLEDVLRIIEGAIYQIGFRPETQNFWVESVPAAAANNPAIAQPGTGGGMNTGPVTATGNNQIDLDAILANSQIFPDFLDWNFCDTFPILCASPQADNLSPIDKVANFFGVGTTGAILIGVGGTLLVVFAAKRAF